MSSPSELSKLDKNEEFDLKNSLGTTVLFDIFDKQKDNPYDPKKFNNDELISNTATYLDEMDQIYSK